MAIAKGGQSVTVTRDGCEGVVTVTGEKNRGNLTLRFHWSNFIDFADDVVSAHNELLDEIDYAIEYTTAGEVG